MEICDERTITGLRESLDEAQRKAIAETLTGPLSMIQNPPGTGETTTIAGQVYSYLSMHPDAKIYLSSDGLIFI